MHDGPGIRTTVFLKDCPLQCVWCHNPEAATEAGELYFDSKKCIGCGACAAVCPTGAHRLTDTEHRFDRELCVECGACTEVCPTGALERSVTDMTAEQIVEVCLRDKPFYGEEGGVTISGGEPMAHSENCLALIRALKAEGLSVALETSGAFDPALLTELVPMVDLFLWDFKDSNPERHRANTGVNLKPIVENMHTADALGAKIRLRCIIVKGIQDNDEHLRAIAELMRSLVNCVGVDLLPYHPMGEAKCRIIGRNDRAAFHSKALIPDKEWMDYARNYLAKL